jgi:hypothetical protein
LYLCWHCRWCISGRCEAALPTHCIQGRVGGFRSSARRLEVASTKRHSERVVRAFGRRKTEGGTRSSTASIDTTSEIVAVEVNVFEGCAWVGCRCVHFRQIPTRSDLAASRCCIVWHVHPTGARVGVLVAGVVVGSVTTLHSVEVLAPFRWSLPKASSNSIAHLTDSLHSVGCRHIEDANTVIVGRVAVAPPAYRVRVGPANPIRVAPPVATVWDARPRQRTNALL